MAQHTEERYRSFFREIDVNGDGSLSIDEVRKLLSSKGYKERDVKVHICVKMSPTSCKVYFYIF